MLGVRSIDERARKKPVIADAAHNQRDPTGYRIADEAARTVVVERRNPSCHQPWHRRDEKVGADPPVCPDGERQSGRH
jgi:hypothetical protein